MQLSRSVCRPEVAARAGQAERRPHRAAVSIVAPIRHTGRHGYPTRDDQTGIEGLFGDGCVLAYEPEPLGSAVGLPSAVSTVFDGLNRSDERERPGAGASPRRTVICRSISSRWPLSSIKRVSRCSVLSCFMLVPLFAGLRCTAGKPCRLDSVLKELPFGSRQCDCQWCDRCTMRPAARRSTCCGA
jgi:hypothetical protein